MRDKKEMLDKFNEACNTQDDVFGQPVKTKENLFFEVLLDIQDRLFKLERIAQN